MGQWLASHPRVEEMSSNRSARRLLIFSVSLSFSSAGCTETTLSKNVLLLRLTTIMKNNRRKQTNDKLKKLLGHPEEFPAVDKALSED